MINFKEVSKYYIQGQEVLRQINLVVQQGEMVFLTGHSGAGKSTLLKLLALLEAPSTGDIIVRGKNLKEVTRLARPSYRASLGIVLQAPQLLKDRSVYANVALPLLMRGLLEKHINNRVEAALDRVGLSAMAHLLPMQLSGGEQQRVGLARAIVHKPLLLLADEPTGNLDPELSRDIMTLFTDLNRLGMTILVATHDLPLIASMKHRMVMLKEGQLC